MKLQANYLILISNSPPKIKSSVAKDPIAVRTRVGGRNVLEQAPVAGATRWADGEHRRGPAHARAVNYRAPSQKSGIGSQELGREIVGALDQ